jgi:hypothetical protein
MRPSRWPTFCPVDRCDRPGRRGHHHHKLAGVLLRRACECDALSRPTSDLALSVLAGTRR